MRRFAFVSLLLFAACTDPVATPVPADLEVLHGPRPVSVPGQRFDTVAVRLLAADGTPIVGWPVSWSGDGTVEPYDSVTDEGGIARGAWTLPPVDAGPSAAAASGTIQLVATAVGFRDRLIETTAHAFLADRIDGTSEAACGLRATRLWCWGASGFSATLDRPVEIPLPAAGAPVEFQLGRGMLCILDQFHDAWCRMATLDAEWHRVEGAPPLEDVTVVDEDVGASACGRAIADQRAWCWTHVGGTQELARPISERAFSSLDGGYRHACGIDQGARAWCWGLNTQGQLGAGDTSVHDTLVAVAGDHRFARLRVGDFLSCASDLGHQIWCWGRTDPIGGSPEPIRVDQSWAVAPEISVGDPYAVYSWGVGQVHAWSLGSRLDFVTERLARYAIADMSTTGPWCVRTVTSEVYCSRAVLTSITDIFYPDDLRPVPDPAAFQD